MVFDANAQAVPVIASATDGLRPHVEHGRTGWLVPPGDSAALAAAIERAGASGPELRRMGLAALAKIGLHAPGDARRSLAHPEETPRLTARDGSVELSPMRDRSPG